MLDVWNNMVWGDRLVVFIIFEYILITCFYLFVDKKPNQALYWFAAALLNIAVLRMSIGK